MSDFLKKFLVEDPRRLQEGATRGIFLGAFGKHPGWDDHVEDWGLESDSLILAKTRLYVEGIGSQIDSGEWEKLEAAQQATAFNHVFVWQRGQQYLLGRMWASSDGKGRKRYPMIVCAHVLGVPLAWALAEVLPALETLERECQSLTAAQEVRQLLDRHRQDLRRRLASLNESTAVSAVSPDVLSSFVAHPELGPDQQGWHRLLYQMESQLQAYAPGRYNSRGDAVRPQQIRVPQCGSDSSESIRLWLRFFNEQVDPAVPILVVLPVTEGWVDVTLGEPTPQEFFSLRASTKKVPLVTEVPYNLDEAFRNRARGFLDDFQRGKYQPNAQALPDPDTTTFFAKPGGGKSKWLKWLVGGAGVIVVLGILVVLMSGSDSGPTEPAESTAIPSGNGMIGGATSSVSVNSTGAAPTTVVEADAVPPALPVESEEAQATRISAVLEEQKQKLAMASAAEEQARLKAKTEAEAEAQAVAKAKADADAKAKAEAEAEAKAEAARLKADQEALAKKMAEEKEAERLAELKRQAEEKARIEETARIAEAQAQLKSQEEAKAKTEVEAEGQAPLKAADLNAAQASAALPKFMTNSIGLELVAVPMNLWAGKYEVTQAQYQRVMGGNPSQFKDDPQRPVESVSWREAMEFCAKLTSLEKESGTLPAGTRYSLPTREQWAGLVADDSLDQAIMSRDGRRKETSPVGAVPGNSLGLHDVLGNVWEWCLDDDASGGKVAMGGSYLTSRTFYFKPFASTSSRQEAPETQSEDMGFRCVLVRAP